MRTSQRPPRWAGVGLIALTALAGCGMPADPPGGAAAEGGGPGRREQRLALSPKQELDLGRKVYRQLLSKADVLDPESKAAQYVRKVGMRIVRATDNRPLRREINLHLDDARFEWTFNVVRSQEANAFCLPGGFVAVFTGLLDVARTDDQLATVLSHEIAHALARHASERLARQQALGLARRAADGDDALSALDARERDRLAQMLSGRGDLRGLAHDRFQESEADHIGVFLQTFAGYDPGGALEFWQRMAARSAGGGAPEILSDHPSDARRIHQLRGWVSHARAAKQAFDEGRIAPEAR